MRGPHPVVIDASAAIAIIRDEPDGRVAMEILTSVESVGTRVIVPLHFWLELMNPLMTRYRMAGLDVLEAIHDLDRFGIETIEADRALVLATLDLAERHGLTAYDAMYLALTIAFDGRLLTFDDELRTAAGARAVGATRYRLSVAPGAYERDVTWPRYREASAYLAHLRAEALAGRG